MELTPNTIFLLKNLRGIIYFSQGVNVEREIKWLKKKFRYRHLGIVKDLATEVKPWKKLAILEVPHKIKVKNVALKSALLASFFATPLLILRKESLGDFGKYIVAYVTSDHLNEVEMKRNIRLANYAITDFYVKMLKLAEANDLKGRKEIVRRDVKRFWRLRGEKIVVAVYIDVMKEKKLLKRKVPLYYLCMVPAVIVDLRYIRKKELSKI